MNHDLDITVHQLVDQSDCDFSLETDVEVARLTVGGRPLQVCTSDLLKFIRSKKKEQERANGNSNQAHLSIDSLSDT